MVSNNNRSVGPQPQGQVPTGTADSGRSDEVFQRELRNMKKATLNGLDMSNYTRHQRRLIDQERCRRSAAKKVAANNQSTPLAPLQPPRARASLQPTSTNSNPISGAPISMPEPTALNDTASRLTSGRPRSCYLFSEHQDLIAQQVPGVYFMNENVDGVYRQWNTNILGAFLCSKKKCKNGWKSGVIATVIRGYTMPGNRLAYNTLVFNQRCIRCESLGYMTIDRDVYIARVVRRLKIWRNEPVEELLSHSKKTPPHISLLCEGCEAGVCTRE